MSREKYYFFEHPSSRVVTYVKSIDREIVLLYKTCYTSLPQLKKVSCSR